MPWLPDDFVHPVMVRLSTGYHLRPIRADDVDIDYPAVMGSRERLWVRYGAAWGWPAASMTKAEDRKDLARHQREIAAHESFNYAILDEHERRLVGCVYLDPPEAGDADADVLVSWWVVDEEVGGGLESELQTFIPQWVLRDWPFTTPRFHP